MSDETPEEPTSGRKRSLSGIKPTGTGSPHLGNYLGMIQPPSTYKTTTSPSTSWPTTTR